MLKIAENKYKFPKHDIDNYDNYIFIGNIVNYITPQKYFYCYFW